MKRFEHTLASYDSSITDDFSARITAAEIRQGAPKLDLHGSDHLDAIELPAKIDAFLTLHSAAGENDVEIVYGNGKGVLRRAVLKVLEEYQRGEHCLVEKVLDKGARCIVLLKK